MPKTRCLDDTLRKTDRLIEILRRVAVNSRSTQPRVFYSVRNVAQHFRVTLSTAARAYHQLEREGLLTRVRGSKTLLQGRDFHRHAGVRAFVGLPASLSDFVTMQSYRMFFISIRRELRLRGFATAMVFTDKDETVSGILSDRLKAYEIDTVLWFQPARETRETVARLADLGIRLIGVAHEQPPAFPCRYEIRRDYAIRSLLTDWKQRHRIDEVTVVRWRGRRPTSVQDVLQDALEELAIETSTVHFETERSECFLRTLETLETRAVVFSSSHLASKLCFQAPEAMADLLHRQRVAFLNGPVSMPFAKVTDEPVDLTVVDWQLVAEQIVDDLVSQDAFQKSAVTVFEAEPKLRVPLSAFAQSI